MAWLSYHPLQGESIWDSKPKRVKGSTCWTYADDYDDFQDRIDLPDGSIRKLIGRDLTWEDEPVEIK